MCISAGIWLLIKTNEMLFMQTIINCSSSIHEGVGVIEVSI